MTNHTHAPEVVTDHECDEFVGGGRLSSDWNVGMVTRWGNEADDAIEDANGNVTLIRH